MFLSFDFYLVNWWFFKGRRFYEVKNTISWADMYYEIGKLKLLSVVFILRIFLKEVYYV